MKVCPKCGLQNDDNSVVCTQCGFLFGNEAAPQNAQPVYQQPPYYAQPAAPKNNGFAIASLILGIAGCTICCMSIIPQILAIVFGFMAKKKIQESNGTEQGENFAKIGTILGFVGIGISVLVWIVYIIWIVMAVGAARTMY